MTHNTAEESKNRYIATMGADLGAEYAELWQEVVYLHRKWLEYVALFGSKPERIPLLNKAAPSFFRMVQDIFWDDTLLHIARLTDPPDSGKGKENLTIQRLPKLISDETLKKRVESIIGKVLADSEFCREWRNKLIAHKDLTVALNGPVDLIQGGSRDQVNAILDGISEAMNAIALHYLDSSTFYRFDGHPGGVLSLLYVLDDGISVETTRLERIMSGQGTERDLSQRNL